MWQILVILSVIFLAYGTLSLSQATMGVGILAIGAILGIFARIAQAEKHQNELKKILGSRENQPQNSE
jgi:hypothetical protein